MYKVLVWLARTCFNSPNDEDLAYKLLCGAWVYLLIVLIQSYAFPAPYGKFTSATGISFLNRLTKLQITPSLGWMIQEIPSFLVGISAMIYLYQQGMIIKMLIITPYVAHYFNRSVIFPLKLKNGKNLSV